MKCVGGVAESCLMLADRTVDVWFAFCHHLLQNLVRENSGGTDLFTGERVIFYCYWQE